MPIYHLSTSHNTCLVVDVQTGVLYHGVPDEVRYRAVYVWIPLDKLACCFVISNLDGSSLMRFAEGVAQFGVMSFRLAKIEGGKVVLRDPVTGNFVSAIISAGPYGEIMGNRTEAKSWEIFTLEGVSDTEAQAVSAEVEALRACLENFTTCETILSYLDRNDIFVTAARFKACLQLLLPDQLEWLGRALLSRPAAVRNLAILTPDDVWLAHALPNLVSYRASGRPATFQTEILDSLDFLAWAGLDGRYVSVGQALNCFARRATEPSKKLCIIATARNEGLYILEWVAHHRALGVEAFFLYTNDNDDGSDPLLEPLVEAGVIYWIKNSVKPGTNPQFKSYAHAFQMLPHVLDYRWAAVIDIDEFIAVDPTRFVDINHFIEDLECEKTDAIALSWVMFGPQGQTRRIDLPVLERFQTRAATVHPLIKTICRTNLFIHSTCHHPVWDDLAMFTFRHADGAIRPRSLQSEVAAFATDPSDRAAWINHYFAKSAEEFVLRRTTSTTNALAIEPSGEYFLPHVARDFIALLHDPNAVSDIRIQHNSVKFAAELKWLGSLDGVASALLAIQHRFYERLRELAVVLAKDPRFSVPDSAEKWFADIIVATVPNEVGFSDNGTQFDRVAQESRALAL